MPAFSMNTEPSLEPAAPLNIDFDIGTATTGGPAPLPDLDLGLGSASSTQSAAGLDFDLGLGADKSLLSEVRRGAAAPPGPPAAEPHSASISILPIATAGSIHPADAAPSLAAIDFDFGTPSVS